MKIKVFVLVFAFLLLLTGCAPSVPVDQYNELLEQVNELQGQLEEMQQTEAPAPAATDEMPDLGEAIATVAPEADPTDPSAGAFDEDTVISQLETTTYSCKSSSYMYGAIVVKNNSEFVIDLEVTAVLYDSDKNIVGTQSDTIYAMEPGVASAMTFMNDGDYDSIECEFSVGDEGYYLPVVSSLSMEVSPAKEKAVISVTNNGDKPAQFVKFIAIFFKGDTPVSIEWGYCVDDDSEIKPGKTQRAEARSFEKFDSVKVYLSGISS